LISYSEGMVVVVGAIVVVVVVVAIGGKVSPALSPSEPQATTTLAAALTNSNDIRAEYFILLTSSLVFHDLDHLGARSLRVDSSPWTSPRNPT